MAKDSPRFMTDAQLREELDKCEYCSEKPCREACPAHCSPCDFIMAAKVGEPSDFRRSAGIIMGSNPLGGVCGAVCPDRFCMKACVHRTFDKPLEIPSIQATIVQKAKDLGVMPPFRTAKPNGRKVAVVGAGPAGYGAAAMLGQLGYRVDIMDAAKEPGGMVNLIPDFRLDKRVLKTDLEYARKTFGDIRLVLGKKVPEPEKLLKTYDAVVITTGLDHPFTLGIPGEGVAVAALEYLWNRKKHPVKGRRVAVIGGGAIACDCAENAVQDGAEHVEMFALEKLSEMPLTKKELEGIVEAGVHLSGRVRISAVLVKGGKAAGLKTLKVVLPKGKKFHPREVQDVPGSEQTRLGFDKVILAIGARPSFARKGTPRVFFAGDVENGPTTVVEAAAAGKNTALEVDACVTGKPLPKFEKRTKSRVHLPGLIALPVPLETDFFGRKLPSPFLLSAAPPSDGYEQMKKAYEAGWAGGVMKTAFDGIDIHIPGEYMFAFTQNTYANCDNVSGHPIDRVRREVGKLVREFPDRLTAVSTGGPVTGDDEADRAGWQSNTKKLESCGAMCIEYSLSCPQGGDGTKGDIVSQDAELTAKIIGWVLEVSDPKVPKLFKLTAAVTAIYPIMDAIRKVLAKYPHKKAGVTLANTFPTLAFRKGAKKGWEEGIVVGMSGEGVTPISNLTLASVSKMGVPVSGNGGPMDYKAAANFLALGANTVQFCTIVMKHGYGVIDDLHSGLSHLMEARGMTSMKDLVGCALPGPVTGFMELTAKKKISSVTRELCQHCGNCTRCPYLAIRLDEEKVPVTDASRCIGCSICAQKCFSGALAMRERTKAEAEMLQES
ncbi:MAG: FAD-dependent oxidoreductase [Elusimicrobiota bacterium]|jgi:NADPH-dependent glutamate synthase beta subunit-like oxidoreductase/dihydroorotate dehydrogenase